MFVRSSVLVAGALLTACGAPNAQRAAGRPRAPLSDAAAELAGMPCDAGTPSANVVIRGSTPGKPPVVHLALELQVQNPLPNAVWLIYDLREPPRIVTEVSLWQTEGRDPTYVWSISGDGSFEAMRIPPGAQLVLRDVGQDVFRSDDAFRIVYATELSIDERPAASWFGHDGMAPALGELRVEHTKLVAERELDYFDAPALRIDVLCLQTVEL